MNKDRFDPLSINLDPKAWIVAARDLLKNILSESEEDAVATFHTLKLLQTKALNRGDMGLYEELRTLEGAVRGKLSKIIASGETFGERWKARRRINAAIQSHV